MAVLGFKSAAIAAALACVAVSPMVEARTAVPKFWVGTWASAQMLVDAKDAIPPAKDVALRQLVRTSIGGSGVRIRMSNVMGTSPMTISGMNLARALSAGSSKIDPSTVRSVTFAGARAVTIPAGAEYVSDPVEMRVPPLTTLAVSMRLAEVPKVQTGHPGSRATSYLAAGDQFAAADLHDARTVDRWYFLSGIDVEPERAAAAIAIVGDSITDGHGVVSNTDTRWTDTLAGRLQKSAATRSKGVLNLGIGGNCVVSTCLGPSAAARFGRDVLARGDVRYLIILEGVNDLGSLTREAPAPAEAHQALVERMIAALAQMTAQARERGIKVIGGTIMPYGRSGYYHPDAANEADRQAVNAWMRTPGHFDAVIDYDALMRDPAQPGKLRKDLDSGDGLHPSAAGYQLMGDAVPLALFTKERR